MYYYRHGALYKVLGEIEIRQNEVGRAREVLMAGLEHDPHYAATYHTAALLEARLGNLEVSHLSMLAAYLCYIHFFLFVEIE